MLSRLRSWLHSFRTTPTIRHRRSPRPTLEQLEDRWAPAVLSVTSLADTTSAGSALTLREAIMVVDGTLGRSLTASEQASVSGTLGVNDTIQFSLPSGPQTITLTGGALSITRPVSIVGPGSLTVSGNGTDRVFYVGSSFSQNLGLAVSMSGLTIAGGKQQYGAGLFNAGTLTLSNVTIANNTANNNGGGGIYNHGALTLNNCTFTNNSTVTGTNGTTAGGGLLSISGSTATLINCTFTGNSAPGTGSTAGSGGAVCNDCQMTLTGCVFNRNSAGSDAGAFFNDGTANATFCTFANNTAGSDGGALHSTGTFTLSTSVVAGNYAASNGGGMEWSSGNLLNISNTTFASNTGAMMAGGLIFWGGNVTLTNVTITGNRAINGNNGTFGGGMWISTPPLLQNTIVAGNFQGSGSTPNDINGNVADNRGGYNLIGTAGSSGLVNGVNGNIVGVVSLGLGTLANNGGPTQTVALLPGSPAIGHGSNAYVAPSATDQRGFARIVNGSVDIGAYEVQGPAPTSITATGFPTTIQAGTAGTITVTAMTSSGSVATGYTGTVHFTSSDPNAVLPADYSFVTSDNGTHTFNVTLKTAGTQSITLTDTVNGSIGATASGITVTPAAASTLALAGFPSSISAGAAGTYSVTARDAFGNIATGYTGTIHFASSDPQAILSADYTFTNLDKGTHSFTATLQTAGTETVTATDNAASSIAGTTPPITVNPAASGPVLTVNSTADNTTADNVLTLREAIAVADGTLGRSLTAAEQAQVAGTLGANDVIAFSLPAGAQTITLTGGALDITAPVTINGPGAASLTINGGGTDRVFIVGQIWSRNLGLAVSINGLTIAGGKQQYGAGLLNFGTLTVSNTTFANNTAGANGGGGLYNVGAMTLNTCTFTGNSVTASAAAGGGIDNISSGTATLTNCTFTRNTATGTGSAACSGAGIANSGTMTIVGGTFTSNSAASDGGAIYNDGSLTLGTSTLFNNTCLADGGAIRSGGSLTISACTFASNYASSVGGALDSSDNSLTINNSTFANNTAGSQGAAIIADPGSGPAVFTNCTITANSVSSGSTGVGAGLYAGRPVTLQNTIIARNFHGSAKAADDIAGTVSSASAFNLIGIGGAGGLAGGVNNNLVGVANPGLGTLSNNGGPTQTIALLAGSPAIDHGSNSFVTSGATDQRGLARVVGGTVDIGAFEVQSSGTTTAASSQLATTSKKKK
jgi:predicted outer membrane repeat protein